MKELVLKQLTIEHLRTVRSLEMFNYTKSAIDLELYKEHKAAATALTDVLETSGMSYTEIMHEVTRRIEEGGTK